MILKSITPRNFGPFAAESALTLDPDVTVLTGPNDVGKSLVLRAIQILCTNVVAEGHDVNRDRTGQFNGRWQDDPEVCCEAEFELTERTLGIGGIPPGFNPGSIMSVRKHMVSKSPSARVTELRRGDLTTTQLAQWSKFPDVLFLPLHSELREAIDLSAMTDAESHLIRLGFGNAFSIAQHKAMTEIARSFRINEGEEKLNSRLKQILPPTMPMRFKLLEVAGDAGVLGVGLIDEHSGFAPIGSRGSGVRRLLNIMGALLRLDPATGYSIVLYDEPEASLHSDAQHMLRRLLESVASHPTIQVVYSTHSPAMINTLRPQSIRVMERTCEGGKAVSALSERCVCRQLFIGANQPRDQSGGFLAIRAHHDRR